MRYADFTEHLEGQKMFQILAKAKELETAGNDVIHLEIGDPDFNSPKIAKDALKRCLDKNITHYVQSSGLPELKDACISATEKSRGFSPSYEQLLITSGANIQIYLAISCLLNPGDEIILSDPSFVSYTSIIKACRGVPVYIPLQEKDSFRLNPEEVKRKINNKTKAIIVNSPHNPTGAVLNRERIQELYRLCDKYGIYLISDEVYGRMIFNDSQAGFYSASQIDHCLNRTILIHSFSKTFAMTGWRIGAVTGPKDIIKRMQLLFETITSCVPPFIQLAAAEVLKHGGQVSLEMINEYQQRRDLLVDGINQIDDISCMKPEGTFYAFANIKNYISSSVQFSNNLLEKRNVATCPGIYFGTKGEGYVRFCFATSKENITTALARMKKGFI